MNKISLYVAIFIAGALTCSLVMKPKEVRRTEDVKYIAELETKLKSITHQTENTVTVVKKDGSKVITTNRDTVIKQDAQTQSSSKLASNKEEIISNKDIMVIAYINTRKEINGYGAMVQGDILGPLGVVVGGLYSDKKLSGSIGVTLKF
jgi:hypothetical protein